MKLSNSLQGIFPCITDIELVQKAIEGSESFSSKKNEQFIIFDYKFSQLDTFPDPSLDKVHEYDYKVRRECRGIIFNSKGQLVARRYHKFFNINELDETSEETIEFKKNDCVLLEKLDGFYVSPISFQEKIRWASKTGIGNKNSSSVEKFVKESPVDYHKFALECLENKVTPIFEFISPERKIVIEYDRNGLILTSIRHLYTGEYVIYDEMKQIAAKFDIPCVNAIKFNAESMKDLISEIKQMKGVEGGVLRFNDGRMYKIKTLFYTGEGKGDSDLLAQENVVWKLILKGEMDDIKANVIKEKLKKRIDKFSQDLFANLSKTGERIVQDIKNNVDLVKVPDLERGLYNEIKKGKDPLQVLMDFMADASNNKSKLEKARYLAGNIRFY